MKPTLSSIAVSLAVIVSAGCSKEQQSGAQQVQATPKQAPQQLWPKIDNQVAKLNDVESRVTEIMATMTLEQKIAQMIQPEIRDISVEDMRKYGFGSYLNGGGAFPNNDKHAKVEDWVALAEKMYQASVDDSLDGSTIPTMWGTDAVHGHNNVIGATLFPHNIGLGAANNPELIEKIAEVTATEVLATGIDWIFAPTVAAVRDDRWGRTYEGYSEDPDIIKAYSHAIVTGLQGEPGEGFLGQGNVISTVKHFVGDGGTLGGDDQGDNISSEEELYKIHAQGYVGGLNAGAQSVMASFNSWHGEKIHGNKYLLNDVLKERMGFDGFVVGDWNGHGQVAGCSNASCPQSINAGLDIFMVPGDWKALYDNTLAQVQSGEISQSRIDDAVRRILRVKVRAGLFEKPSPAQRIYAGKSELIGSEAHREVARQAVRESLVLLKNNEQLLPLKPNTKVLVAGDAADNIGKQSGGWTITWQGTNNENTDFPGGTSIWDGISAQVEAAGGSAQLSEDGSFEQKPDVAIVIFGEEPYAEGHGDRANLEYQAGDKRDLALLKRLKEQGIPVVSVFISGRPMWVNPELNASDAFVAAWLPGSEGLAVADVLFSDADGQVQHDFTGRLSYSWPKTPTQLVNRGDQNYAPLLPYGFGLSYGDKNVLNDELDEQVSSAHQQQSSVPLFTGTVQKPWQLWLYSGDESIRVSANTHEVGALFYRTIDKVVQEDARKLRFNGSANAGIRLASKSFFREDLRAKLGSDVVVKFNLNLEQAPNGAVYLGMNCESEGDAPGSCGAQVDISEQLKAMPLNTWQPLTVDLHCFTTQGFKLHNTVVPFELSTQGQLTVSIADISLEKKSEQSGLLSCN
ncbi:glycoside hydrolase family 3 protein [Pseudoalteromonas sp. T1lg48]|uniref:glycoside hydrolase family 3 protein n=1 Tax=Pseudoalteromonas sp. T1lg48 TaxID=2077100 RepID=UPI000CF6D012|nr:exo 1,3/1,4-beta-D-glucan glucohydrolase [Pseudoalteromonas sp. T1lg48]